MYRESGVPVKFRPTVLFVFEDGCPAFATGNKKHICLNVTFSIPFVDQEDFLVIQHFQGISRVNIFLLTVDMLQSKTRTDIGLNSGHGSSNLLRLPSLALKIWLTAVRPLTSKLSNCC